MSKVKVADLEQDSTIVLNGRRFALVSKTGSTLTLSREVPTNIIEVRAIGGEGVKDEGAVYTHHLSGDQEVEVEGLGTWTAITKAIRGFFQSRFKTDKPGFQESGW